jgi:hypothetical protein
MTRKLGDPFQLAGNTGPPVYDCSCSAEPEIGVAGLLLPLMAQITEDATAMDGTPATVKDL